MCWSIFSLGYNQKPASVEKIACNELIFCSRENKNPKFPNAMETYNNRCPYEPLRLRTDFHIRLFYSINFLLHRFGHLEDGFPSYRDWRWAFILVYGALLSVVIHLASSCIVLVVGTFSAETSPPSTTDFSSTRKFASHESKSTWSNKSEICHSLWNLTQGAPFKIKRK